MHANRSRVLFHVMLLASLLATLLGSAADVQPARADTIIVTSTADTGPGTLRQAVLDAVSGDTITFSVSGTITLAAQIDISKDLTISGPGAASLTLSGGGTTRIFSIIHNTVSISGLTIANGFTVESGGGIYCQGGGLMVDNVIFSNNHSTNGAGIFVVNGVLSVSNSVFTGGSAANGGGIRVERTVTTLSNSAIVGNTASNYGGGLIHDGGSDAANLLVILNSTFSGNVADLAGGIYLINGSTAMIANSTFSANSATNVGGGLINTNLSAMTLINNTFSGNSAINSGGGILNFGGLTILNNIVANSPSGSDCVRSGGGYLIASNNLIETGNCQATTNLDPMLGPLGNYGGSTPTHNLLPGSPAIDAGDNAICAADPINNLDQRGVNRPLDGDGNSSAICDMGSFESNQVTSSSITTITSDNPDPSLPGQSVSVGFSVVASVQGGGEPTGDVTVSDGVDSCTNTVTAGSCSLTLTTAGSRTLTATYAGDSNFNGSSDTEAHTVDASPPQVGSITRADASPTNAASVDFTVTFTEPVTGVDASDFNLAMGGSLSGASVSGVSGAGAVYTVNVDTGTGSGSLRLDLDAMNTIQDLVGNPLSGAYTDGEDYTIDKDAPQVNSSTRIYANPTNADSVVFRVTFSEVVTGVDVSDFTLTGSGSLVGFAVSGMTGSGTTYNVTVSTGSGDGTLRLDVVDDDTIHDAVGNPLNAGFTGGESYTVDRTAPTVVSSNRADPNPTSAASVDFVVTFSEAVTGVDVTDFAVTTTGGVAGTGISGLTGSGTTYTVTVGTGSGNGTLRLDVVDDNSVMDLASNALNGGFTAGQVYTMDKTDPAVVSSLRADPNPTSAATVDFIVTFSEAVTGVDITDFTISTTGSLAGTVVSGLTGSGTTYTVSVSTGSGAGNLRLDVLDDDTVLDTASNPLAGGFTSGEVYQAGFIYNWFPLIIYDSSPGGR